MSVAPSFFVSISNDLLFQTFSMAFSAAVAFAGLVHTSLMLSRSYVMLLPRYVNCSTFSRCLPSINNFPAGSFSPNTIVLVFSKFMLSPYLLPSSFSARVVSASLWASSSIRSISSANARLLILVPLIFTPPSLSLMLYSILSNTSMKVFGDIGSPCLVPLLVIALITSSSNISSSLSSPIGVISFNSAITSSAVFSSNCSLYSSLQYVVHLCTMSSLFMSVLPSSFLIAVSFGFLFLLTFLISLYISLVLPSPWYLSMSLHWSSNHLALSFLADFRTSLLFVLYVHLPRCLFSSSVLFFLLSVSLLPV